MLKLVGLDGDIDPMRLIRPIVIDPVERTIYFSNHPRSFQKFCSSLGPIAGADLFPGNRHAVLYDALWPVRDEKEQRFWFCGQLGGLYAGRAFVFGISDLLAPAGDPEEGFERLLMSSVRFLGNRRSAYETLTTDPSIILKDPADE